MKTYILDGNKINDLNDFFYEVSKMMLANNVINIRNFSQYDDLLEGGYGDHKIEEPICIKWINYKHAKEKLGTELFLKILELTLDFNNTNRDVKLELF